MNLLRNVNDKLGGSSRLLKSLKRAEQYLFSLKELDNGNHSEFSGASSPSSVPSFKSLFQEEARMLPSYLSKLNVDSRHPVMSIARDFYGQNPNTPSVLPSLQLRAMFVLLIAKSIGLPKPSKASNMKDVEYCQLVDSKQRQLSQITELLFAAHTLHRSVVDLGDLTSPLHSGNKLATLIGDLLMAKTSRRLSDLKNHRVTELMSNTICEFSASGFIGERITTVGDKNSRRINDSLPKTISGPQLTYPHWLERSRQSMGSIIGNSCISCMMLAGQGQDGDASRFVSDLGKYVGILLQAYRDFSIFVNEDGSKSEPQEFMDHWTLPVIFEVERSPSLIPEDISKIDHLKIFETVQTSQYAIRSSIRVLLNFQSKITSLVSQLEPSEPASIILEILTAMCPKNIH